MDLESEPKSRLEELREAIDNSPSRIEDEFKRTPNNWLSCLGTRISLIEISVGSKGMAEFLAEDKRTLALARLEKLKDRLFELRPQYPDKDTIPPEDVRQELVDSLDVLRDPDSE